ncbi:urea amidolyase family protein [Microbacterium sediminis]|uniref:Allophanate hydrolase n=1 Tax=Microbacterium sediminis TaxID=904291 RepID=A0A1B9NAB0_9MICO|nr:urea amidolyase family protein [Microbacterium sediminis]OCG73552.1 allophanate hydrolase [Microbacterium sediminis]QBR73226.1 5-oxoprolinase/urea amidolyase family protein [Microbacterium sediminis]
MRILPAGVDGLIVELDDLEHALALYRALQADPIPGVAELIPAARTVYARFRPALVTAEEVAGEVRSRTVAAGGGQAGELVRIPVVYDGEDLAEVAALVGMSVDEVVARHHAPTYSVAFTGFAPGFAYISGGDPALHVPRRSTPRTVIPAGALAIAGEFTGIYPRSSPGGWQLIGHTTEAMWDLRRDPPALLQPGARVEFVPTREQAAGSAESAAVAPAGSMGSATAATPAGSMGSAAAVATTGSSSEARSAEPRRVERSAAESRPGLEILAAGPHALLQDLGRTGVASLGVSPSGAMDRGALRRANRLVGNHEAAPAIEAALGGLELRARGPVTIAVSGAPAPLLIRTADGASLEAPAESAFALDDGDVLALGAADCGVYSYVAARGSFDVAPVLGSAARDVLAALGPDPLAAGAVLPIGTRVAGSVPGWHEPVDPLPSASEITWLDVVLGPRTDWCTPEALATLAEQEWVVTPQSNRVGLRLQGERPIERAITAELPSEATAAGSLQIPASGQPVLFTADHPLTGGYPVIGVVADADLDRAAQVPVGGRIRFRIAAPFVDYADASARTTPE